MGEFGGGERYDDNPFIYFESSEYIVNPQSKQEMPNPLKAMYEELAPLLLRSPPSKRYPQQPTGMKDWDILTDPISELVFTSAVPDPVIGQTLQRVMRPTVEGKEGLATHLNILVDCSSSMGDGLCYGVSPTGFPLAGYHLAQICTAMMIAQAELAKDSFSVWGFNSGGFTIWPGQNKNTKNTPAQNHKQAIEFFLDQVPQGKSPFRPHNGTSINAGLNRVAEDMQDFEFDQAVTVVMIDGAISTVGNAREQLLNTSYAYNDETLRKMGPVFYVVFGSPASQTQLDTTIRVMREALSEYYGRDMEGCVLSFEVMIGDDGDLEEMGGSLVEMAMVNAGLNTKLKPCPRI